MSPLKVLIKWPLVVLYAVVRGAYDDWRYRRETRR